MDQFSQVAGFVGALIVAIAYLPQILHLARQHCSAGVSLGAWLLWLLGSVLVLSHAIRVADGVFVTLQIVSIVAIVVVLVLCKRYQGMTCPLHGGHGRVRRVNHCTAVDVLLPSFSRTPCARNSKFTWRQVPNSGGTIRTPSNAGAPHLKKR